MLLELWTIQARSLRKQLETAAILAQLRQMVASDVQRAARLIAGGLAALDVVTQRPSKARDGRPARVVVVGQSV